MHAVYDAYRHSHEYNKVPLVHSTNAVTAQLFEQVVSHAHSVSVFRFPNTLYHAHVIQL